MPRITFVTHAGAEYVVDAQVGDSLMQVATSNLVPGVLADCGGNCACATCHVYLDESWDGRVLPVEPGERDMLEFALHPEPGRSRLSCQVQVADEHDGLVVRLPPSQI
jgi:2Fe-2S ferredoxin